MSTEGVVLKSLAEAEQVPAMGTPLPLANYLCHCENGSSHIVTVYRGRAHQDDFSGSIKVRCPGNSGEGCQRFAEFIEKYKKDAA